MPDYIRRWRPGGTFFFTVNLLERRGNDLLVRHIDALREAVRVTRAERPFEIVAWVVLPDHMHAIWSLPESDSDYATRWAAIKARFFKTIPLTEYRNPSRVARRASRVARGERGVWRRRYWEHTIRDERDLANHIDYIHINPVKHGVAARASPRWSEHLMFRRMLWTSGGDGMALLRDRNGTERSRLDCTSSPMPRQSMRCHSP